MWFLKTSSALYIHIYVSFLMTNWSYHNFCCCSCSCDMHHGQDYSSVRICINWPCRVCQGFFGANCRCWNHLCSQTQASKENHCNLKGFCYSSVPDTGKCFIGWKCGPKKCSPEWTLLSESQTCWSWHCSKTKNCNVFSRWCSAAFGLLG